MSTGNRSSTLVDSASMGVTRDSVGRAPIKLRASTTYGDEFDAYASTNPYGQSMHQKRRSKSKERDVLLLDNGLIVERVDIAKEEREEERQRDGRAE